MPKVPKLLHVEDGEEETFMIIEPSSELYQPLGKVKRIVKMNFMIK